MQLNWINSAGGPLVCGGREASSLWRGVSGSSVGAELTDYARACEVEGYLGCVPSGANQLLVLGDEPLQTSFVPSIQAPALARWVAARSPELVELALSELPQSLPMLTKPVIFEVRDTEVFLFDSATDFDSRAHCASVPINPGMYGVTTEEYRNGREFRLLIHRFIALQ